MPEALYELHLSLLAINNQANTAGYTLPLNVFAYRILYPVILFIFTVQGVKFLCVGLKKVAPYVLLYIAIYLLSCFDHLMYSEEVEN